MSTGVDARRRPGLWSYISFSSSPRKRSISLPKPNNNHGRDSHGNISRQRNGGWSTPAPVNVENTKESWMTGGQRARLLKTGGILAFVVFLLYLFTPSNTAGEVKELVKGWEFSLPLLAETSLTEPYRSCNIRWVFCGSGYGFRKAKMLEI